MRRLLVSRSSDIPVGMSVIRGTRVLQSVSAAVKARLTAAYNRELGHLTVWPSAYCRRSGRVEVAFLTRTAPRNPESCERSDAMPESRFMFNKPL